MEGLSNIALVTGGSRGIGRAVALALAADGFDIFFTYRSNHEEAGKVVSEIASSGRVARAFCVDSSDSAQVSRFFEDEIRGKVFLSVLVNNAGLARDSLIMRMKDEDFLSVMETNLHGAFYFLREASKIMTRQRSGSIINSSSVVGLMGNPGQANYSAAKAGIIGLTKSAARELAGRSVRVNAVAPGFIETDMTAGLPEEVRERYASSIPLKRFGTPRDVADAVSFLASPRSAYITGQVISVNGGLYC